jgi:hypothetical protein
MQPPGAARSARPARSARSARNSEHDNAVDVVATLHRAIGNHAVHGLLEAGRALCGSQLKRNVSSPGDVYEQEADLVARRVSRLPPGSASAASVSGESCCSACEAKAVPARTTSAPALAASPVPERLVEEFGAGHSLDSSTQAFFEPILGVDLGGVRIHADQSAASAAGALNARAFTAGHHVFFGTDRYAPGTATGRALLAHELTHVLQQAASRGSDAPVPTIQRVTDQPELQAGIEAGLHERAHPEDETLFGAWRWTCLSHFMAGEQLMSYAIRILRIYEATDPKVRNRLINELVLSVVPGVVTNPVCGCFPPSWMVEIARWWLRDEPDALAHLEHYLEGSGTPYVEDVQRIFAEDPHFKETMEVLIADKGPTHDELLDVYPSYSTGNWKNSFGGIDRIEYEILPENFSSADGTVPVRVTIEDDYDWHPDEHRAGPCLHTGMEIMKGQGAKSYRQIGTAIVRLKVP